MSRGSRRFQARPFVRDRLTRDHVTFFVALAVVILIVALSIRG